MAATDTWITFFKAHERVIILAMSFGVTMFGMNKWFDKAATDAATKAAVTQQIATVQHDADVKVAVAIARQTALFNQEQQVRDQQMASIISAVAARDAASHTQIVDVQQSKTPSQAVIDLQTHYTLTAPVTVTATGADVSTADLQQFTVTKIESDTAKADLADTQKELSATNTSLTSATSLVGALQNQVTGLQTEIKTDTAACTTEIASVKATARKSKIGWFKAGAVIGYIAGLATGHYL